MGIVILVCFVVIMLLWGLALLGASPLLDNRVSGWLPFAACLLLGLAVFVGWYYPPGRW